MKENDKFTNKKRLFSKQSYAKILSTFALGIILFGSLAPTVVSAASITEYTAIPVVSDDGEKLTYEVIMATDGDDSFIGGEGYDYESGGQNVWDSASLPVGCKMVNGQLDTTSCSHGKQVDGLPTGPVYANSWNGSQDVNEIDVRVGSSPEELASASEKTAILTEEFNNMITYVSGGGVTTSNTDAFIQGGMTLATQAYYAGVGKITDTGNSAELGFTSGEADTVYYKISPATAESAAAAKKSLPQTLFNTDNVEIYKEQFVTISLCTDASCQKIKESETFLWLIPKGYYTGGDLNATLSSTILASNPDAACNAGDCTAAMKTMGVYDWYSINSIATNAAYAYTDATVAATDSKELSNIVNESTTNGPLEKFADILGGFKYKLESWLSGIPAPHEFMNPYGEFSTWFFGVVPQALSSIFLIALGISFVFSIALYGYSVLIRLLQVKTTNNDNSNIYAESSEILKGAGMYVFGTFLMYGLLIACLIFSDTMYEIFWEAFGGTANGASDKLIIEPATMVNGIMHSIPMSVAYSATVAAWYMMILYQKVQIMIYAILIPITSIEFSHASGWDVVFQRLPQMLYLTVGKSMAYLFSYGMLVVLQGSEIEMKAVMAGFVFTLVIVLPQMILKTLGVKDTLFPAETASIMASAKLNSAARSGWSKTKGSGGGSGSGGSGGSGGSTTPFGASDAQSNLGAIKSQTTMDKNASTGKSATTDVMTGKTVGDGGKSPTGAAGRAAAIVGGGVAMAGSAYAVASSVGNAVKTTADVLSSPNNSLSEIGAIGDSYKNVGSTVKSGKATATDGMNKMKGAFSSTPNVTSATGNEGSKIITEMKSNPHGGQEPASFMATEFSSMPHNDSEEDLNQNGGVFHMPVSNEDRAGGAYTESVKIGNDELAIQKLKDNGLNDADARAYHKVQSSPHSTQEQLDTSTEKALKQGYIGTKQVSEGRSPMAYEDLGNGKRALSYQNTAKSQEFVRKSTLNKNGIVSPNAHYRNQGDARNSAHNQYFASSRERGTDLGVKSGGKPNGGQSPQNMNVKKEANTTQSKEANATQLKRGNPMVAEKKGAEKNKFN